jgi:hypothetical protein
MIPSALRTAALIAVLALALLAPVASAATYEQIHQQSSSAGLTHDGDRSEAAPGARFAGMAGHVDDADSGEFDWGAAAIGAGAAIGLALLVVGARLAATRLRAPRPTA